MKREFSGSFNKEYARKVSKADFIENHKAWAEQVDLGAEWENLQEKPKDLTEGGIVDAAPKKK